MLFKSLYGSIFLSYMLDIPLIVIQWLLLIDPIVEGGVRMQMYKYIDNT